MRQLLAKSGEPADAVLTISMELGSTEAIKEAVLAGYGISILSRIAIRQELADGRLVEVPIRDLVMERGFYEVYHGHRPLHPNAQAFRDFLRLP
jgi:DNA-binding transcriptional LysR family regulator